ncbi:MAG: hypothetical protein WKG01_31085 [Kofleriaceae bacterium]
MRRLILVLLAACSDRSAPPKSAPPPVVIVDGAAPAPSIDLGPLGAEPPVWPDATGPAGPVTFAHDFSKPGTWRHTYRQNMTMTANFEGDIMINPIQAKGTLTIESQRNRTAKATLDAVARSFGAGSGLPNTSAPLQMVLELPETGSAKTDDPQAAMLAILMPTPPRPLRVGESFEVPFMVPVTGIPGLTSVTGPMTFKFAGYSQIGTRTCARFTSRLAIDETRGDAKVKMKLDGRLCLDPADASVVVSHQVIDVKVVSKGPIEMSFAGVLGLDRE